jgi:CheY-like chemotaxis protein
MIIICSILNSLGFLRYAQKYEKMLNVLYVDDEPSMLRLISLGFEDDEEICIFGMSSPCRALELLRTNHFDVLLSDYQMPEADGIRLLEQLRRRGDDTPFILYTDHWSDEVFVEAREKGADLCLKKSIDPIAQSTELKNALVMAAKKVDRDPSRRLKKRRPRPEVRSSVTISK